MGKTWLSEKIFQIMVEGAKAKLKKAVDEFAKNDIEELSQHYKVEMTIDELPREYGAALSVQIEFKRRDGNGRKGG